MSGLPTRVVRASDGHGWTLLRGDAPYYIHGVGGTGQLARAAALGANSARTWSTSELGATLDAAHAVGMTVCAGLWVRHASLGADWFESTSAKHVAERAAKLEEFRAAIRAHRNHPALLLWAVGNEPNADGFNGHAPLWRYVNELARMVKAEGACGAAQACACVVAACSRLDWASPQTRCTRWPLSPRRPRRSWRRRWRRTCRTWTFGALTCTAACFRACRQR